MTEHAIHIRSAHVDVNNKYMLIYKTYSKHWYYNAMLYLFTVLLERCAYRLSFWSISPRSSLKTMRLQSQNISSKHRIEVGNITVPILRATYSKAFGSWKALHPWLPSLPLV